MIAPARTGRDRRRRAAVIRMDQTRRGILSRGRFLFFILMIVEMKLIAPKIEDIPAMWREKIAKSTDAPL